MKNLAVLHYIYDPLCGWCYAIAPLIAAAAEMSDLEIRLYAGGLMTGSRRKKISSEWREYVLPHDKRIALLTGQLFGDAYFNGLLRNENAVLDSIPPTKAILLAQKMNNAGLAMLARIQKAHFVEGREVAQTETLVELAQELGLQDFVEQFDLMTDDEVQRHIAATRQLMAQSDAQSFPTLLLEPADGQMNKINGSSYFGRTDVWRTDLQKMLSASQA